MGAFDPSAHALFVAVGHSRPGRGGNGMAGWPWVVGGSRSSGGCRHRVRKAGVDRRGLARVPVWQGRVRGAGATAGRGCCGQHKSNTSPVQEGSNTDETAFPGIPWHGCLKLLCQPNYQDGCALAGLTDEYSPGGIGRDRPSEKREVGKSDAALTAISRFTRNGLPHLRKCGEAPSFVLWLE